ncbi:hypothetical protein RhiirA5_285060, partial [Rhizophagus irregularis]
NGLQKVNFSGKTNSVLLETLPEERLCLHTLLAKHNKKDIYNTDKTGLFFQIEPNYTLDSGKISGQKQVEICINLFCFYTLFIFIIKFKFKIFIIII